MVGVKKKITESAQLTQHFSGRFSPRRSVYDLTREEIVDEKNTKNIVKEEGRLKWCVIRERRAVIWKIRTS